MSRRPGIAAIQQKRRLEDQFKVMGEETKAKRREEMKKQMEIFKEGLEKFALKYKEEIRRDPAFRAKFYKMCSDSGVDPLVSNKNYWEKFLGIGQFYAILGVQIIEACIATRPINGGFLDIIELLRYVRKRRGSVVDQINESDLIIAIKHLKPLEGGFDLVKVGEHTLVKSVPGELNLDKNKILQLAHEKGYVSEKRLREELGWNDYRINEILNDLLYEGLAMVDDGAPDHVRLYWFPCVMTSLTNLS